jgi:hypothetical protein
MRQVMLRDKEQQYAFQHAHPFSSTMEELASTAYKYRKWQLTPDMALIARCEVDGTTATVGTTLSRLQANRLNWQICSALLSIAAAFGGIGSFRFRRSQGQGRLGPTADDQSAQ